MLIQVEEARYLGAHRVWLRFSDGRAGEIDLADALGGPVFEPLRDPSYFSGFAVDETLIWPNGADFAPEFLYERLSVPSPAGSASAR
jgi:hypothetical protein